MKSNNYIKRQVQKAIMTDLEARHKWQRYVSERTNTAIAERFGVSYGTVYLIQTKATRKLTPYQKLQVIRMREEYWKGKEVLKLYSNKAIARRYGVCEVTVKRYHAKRFDPLPMSYEDHMSRAAA
ncbi:hypothetical protein RE428_32290 [Marinobacter nanhaiticus D15-8W]|uniref:HTH psq-type domain-containing protein n=1 Tax=Marinobacter nanhaiticus D15-8W TaxID=626887 RepID=N6W300_9GAMM|nr:hypothetical protein [Marinobacter nanhaiticus]ENO16920.1 hypothetical protein J057_01910 [Marinobacter nanhaiticus D15-8W]BES72211.1 hypothetical protein RE428_32290 [Marinobacter nanhaiticus D15-8W]